VVFTGTGTAFDINVGVTDASGGMLALMPGSHITADGGNVHFRVPYNNIVTRGDVSVIGPGFDFFNLIGLSSFSFDAEETGYRVIPTLIYDAFAAFPVVFGQYIDSSRQWKEALIPAAAIRAETSKVVFEEEQE
jgi:hypothetical protein